MKFDELLDDILKAKTSVRFITKSGNIINGKITQRNGMEIVINDFIYLDCECLEK